MSQKDPVQKFREFEENFTQAPFVFLKTTPMQTALDTKNLTLKFLAGVFSHAVIITKTHFFNNLRQFKESFIEPYHNKKRNLGNLQKLVKIIVNQKVFQ